jgi:hypothetical protein
MGGKILKMHIAVATKGSSEEQNDYFAAFL